MDCNIMILYYGVCISFAFCSPYHGIRCSCMLNQRDTAYCTSILTTKPYMNFPQTVQSFLLPILHFLDEASKNETLDLCQKHLN